MQELSWWRYFLMFFFHIWAYLQRIYDKFSEINTFHVVRLKFHVSTLTPISVLHAVLQYHSTCAENSFFFFNVRVAIFICQCFQLLSIPWQFSFTCMFSWNLLSDGTYRLVNQRRGKTHVESKQPVRELLFQWLYFQYCFWSWNKEHWEFVHY